MAEVRSKSELWNLLKEVGWKPPQTKSYVQWTAEELELEYGTKVAEQLMSRSGDSEIDSYEPEPETIADPAVAAALEEMAAEWGEVATSGPVPPAPAPVPTVPAPAPQPVPQPQPVAVPAPEPVDEWPNVPRSDEADKVAGLRMRTHGPDDPVRIDTQGRIWYQDEVRKPATASPRARSVLTYQDSGFKTVEDRNQLGLLEESFEVPGDESRTMQVKVTLPSWQVGIYKDPRLPFRVHIYNDIRGFHRLDVVKYYGGMDNVPSSITTIYVGGDLCYDIVKTRDAIEREYRERVLRIGSFQ